MPTAVKQTLDPKLLTSKGLDASNFQSKEVKKEPVKAGSLLSYLEQTGQIKTPGTQSVIKPVQEVMKPMSQELPAPTAPTSNTFPNGQPILASMITPGGTKKSNFVSKSEMKKILDNAPSGVDKGKLLIGLVQKGKIIEGYNDPQSQITQAPVPVAPQITYGENKIQDQKQPGSLRRGIASLGGDMGNLEWLNPVGKVFENVDNAIQKIPVVTKDNVANAFNKLVPGFGDSMVEGGGPNVIQMLANVPGSLLKTTSATARGITNPVDTMQGLYKLVATDEGHQVIKDRYGSMDNFAKSMDQDPVGVASDILTVVQGGASLAGGTAKLASAGAKSAGYAGTAGKLASFADDASRLGATAGGAADLGLGVGMEKLNAGIGNIASKPLRIAAKTALAPTQPLTAGKEVLGETKKALQGTPGEVSFVDRAISAYNGLDSETVRQMKDQPEIVKALDEGKITKESIKSDLVDAVDQVTSEKKAVGSQYSEVYNNPTRYNAGDIITDINKGLTDQGVVIKGGKIVGFDTTKMTGLTDQAKTALKSKYEDVIATLKSKTDVGVEDLHNIRKDMYMTSYQDGFMTKKAPGVSKVSDILNERLKKIPGFNELDAGYREAADLAKEIKDSVVNKEGDFKGTLKALLGERGAKRMDILDKHFPGLKDKIKTLAAYDDYLNTRTRKKVGMYEKAGTAGAAAIGGFMLGGPLGAIISGIAGPILSDFIRDPKRFKNYIISKAGKEIASKIELGTELDIAEKTRLNRIISELEKDPQKALPYKPTQATPVSPSGKVQTTAVSPNPTIKQSTIVRETGVANKPGTTKVNPQAIVKKSEVVKSVDPSVETLKKLQSNTTLQKVQPFERIPSNVKGKGYTTQYGDIEKIEFDRGREVYEIGGKTYKASDVEIYKPKEAPVAKKFTTEQELKIDSLKKYKEQGQRKRSYLQELLNGKSIDSLEPKQVDDFFELVNKRKRDDTAMSKLDTVKQGETPVKTVPKTTETKIESKKATVDQELQNIAKKVKEKSIAKKENGSIMDSMKTTITDQIKEAKASGKTFEEFIEGNKVYHGTNQQFDDFDIELGGKATSSMPSAKGNIFFTKDKAEAIAYAKNANKGQIVNQKDFDKRAESTQDKIDNLQSKGKRDEADALTEKFEEEYYKKINTLQAGKQVGPEIAMERYIDPTKIKEIKIGGQITAGDLMGKLDIAKKEGYLGAKLVGIIDAPAEFFPNNKGTTQFAVWNKKALIDKTQLKAERDKLSPKSDIINPKSKIKKS